MRKRPAAVLLGMFVLVTGTYMGWCALPCLPKIFLYDKDVPDDARTAINEWRKTSPLLKPAAPRYFVRSFLHPFEPKFDPMEVEMRDPVTAEMRHGTGGIFFVRNPNGVWKGTIHDCCGTHPVN